MYTDIHIDMSLTFSVRSRDDSRDESLELGWLTLPLSDHAVAVEPVSSDRTRDTWYRATSQPSETKGISDAVEH